MDQHNTPLESTIRVGPLRKRNLHPAKEVTIKDKEPYEKQK